MIRLSLNKPQMRPEISMRQFSNKKKEKKEKVMEVSQTFRAGFSLLNGPPSPNKVVY